MTAALLIPIVGFLAIAVGFYLALLPDKRCAHDLRAVGPNRWRCAVCKREVK